MIKINLFAMRVEILQYLKDNDTGHLIKLNDKLKELLGNKPVHILGSLLREMHEDHVAVISGNYGWLGGSQGGVPHTLDNIHIEGRILPPFWRDVVVRDVSASVRLCCYYK